MTKVYPAVVLKLRQNLKQNFALDPLCIAFCLGINFVLTLSQSF